MLFPYPISKWITVIKPESMKTIRYINRTALATAMLLVLLLTACNENYLKYDTSYNGIYFTKDTLTYSFSVSPVEYKEHVFKIPVAIMGGLSNEKRAIGYEVIEELTSAVEGEHYTIGEACILPDSITGYIPVTVYRSKLEGTYPDYTRYKLALQLVLNDCFVPTLDSLHQVRVFTFDNAIEQPEWLNSAGEKIWSLENLGVWHPLKLIKMVEYFHAIEDVLPETYIKMVKQYGENLEHISGGYPTEFKITFEKYVYAPMYEYFSNPANEEYIKSEFPDFPFDFPDPYNK